MEAMATFELYKCSTIGMCLTETLKEMVSSDTLSPGLAIQVLAQLDKSMTDALENPVKSNVTTVKVMDTFELYRRSTIGMCLTETIDETVTSSTLSRELSIQVLVQFDKSMTKALENQVKSKVTVKSCCWNLEEEKWGMTGEEGDDAVLCGCSNPNVMEATLDDDANKIMMNTDKFAESCC